jgi:NAD(P)-dependent dehydrogenase (short-subunit alcohol dehydrogenase family)
MLTVSYKPSCVSFLMLKEMAGRGMAGELEEKIALVTGGNSRIGLATAAVLLASDDASYMAGAERFVDGGTVQVG